MKTSVSMASNVQDLPVQQTFVEEIDYTEIQELSVNIAILLCLIYYVSRKYCVFKRIVFVVCG